MSIELAIYLISAFSGIKGLLATIAISLLFVLLICILFHAINLQQIIPKKCWIPNVFLILVLSFFAVLIPSEKTMYTILAVSATKEIAKNPQIKSIYDKSMLLLNKKLDEQIKGASE